MSLSTEEQKENLKLLIKQAEIGKFQAESMGKAYQTIGNAHEADAFAKRVASATMLIANLTEQLEALK
jgi:hypothetical protein